MASSSDRVPSRRQSMANLTAPSASPSTSRDHASDLSASLNKLSLATSPAHSRNAPRSPSALSPYRSIGRATGRAVSSSAAVPGGAPRAPSRSPSVSRDSPSRSSTPTLLRKASTSSLRSANGRAPSQPPSRRSSLAHSSSSPSPKNGLAMAITEEPVKPPPTANSVASEYFRNELDILHTDTSTHRTDTVVIMHDACYGHRFSRPKTSRNALSTIVERPERIKAGALGVALAYVRLGDRHCDGAYPVHPKLDPASIPTLPFRIHKSTRRLPLLSPAVTNVHGTKWMEELKMMCNSAEAKLAMGGKELQRPDMNRGTEGTPAKFHEGDLYLCSESLDALEGALGAVCEAVDRVFTAGPRRAFVAVRPPGHHCSASYPSGFCWVNNVHVGIMHGVLSHGLTHAAIIDFDLHHGDGSQSITWQHNTRATQATKNAAAWKKSSIGYFSLHDINSYPCEMGDEEKVKNASLCIDNAHGQSVWNVHLHSWDTDADFWRLYETKYMTIIEKTRLYLRQQAERLRAAGQAPKAAIFFSAGFDASEWETKGMQRHNVNVPTEFYARITQDVVKLAAEEGLGVEGRVISVLEGGYSDRALYSGIFSHLSGMVGDQSPGATGAIASNGLAYEMGQRIGTIDESNAIKKEEEDEEKASSLASLHAYNASWWASTELDGLETAMGTPPAEPKKPRYNVPPTYSSPTQASTARISNPAKVRRSMSGLSSVGASLVRPPSPPPPEVPWAIAAHELSKLLIPSDRQTDSCQAEDLNAEATRARRDRQSVLNPTLVTAMAAAAAPPPAPSERPTSRMSLRERKTVKTYQEIDEDEIHFKGRRKTVAGPAVLAAENIARPPSADNNTGTGVPVKRAGRRLSGVSSVATTPARKPIARTASGSVVPTAAANPTAAARPESSMSTIGQTLPVKKTRAPAATRGGAARAPRGGKKAAPASKLTTTTESAAAGPSRSTVQPVTPDTEADPMDSLTSGMKKIRINLITKSQKEERERAAAASASTSAAPSPTPDSSMPPPPPPGVPIVHPASSEASRPNTSEGSVVTYSSPPRRDISTPVSEHASTGRSPDPRSLALPASSPPAILGLPAGEDVFVAYQPEGPEPVAVAGSEDASTLKWLPPNTTATPAGMRRTDLPVFTATSAIPFAPRGAPGQGGARTDESTK
ncbi:histone deacetylase [Plectosphaerella plurivora]|uniref:Histone deacetylase n=1 Tax=Plectosphaerella plurivora TaxID=936078 RepID=A0A9P9A7F4_9PEZI|nr:histone deacetylase [Plectosphaerella plurivora]